MPTVEHETFPYPTNTSASRVLEDACLYETYRGGAVKLSLTFLVSLTLWGGIIWAVAVLMR